MYKGTYEESDIPRSFNVGEYSIPANYRGNAFTAGEIPIENSNGYCETVREDYEYDRVPGVDREKCSCEERHNEIVADNRKSKNDRHETGLLSRLLNGFGRDIEFDDILLIGLVVLILHEKKNGCNQSSDEVLILLVILFLLGF